jgi:hypothetical protein
MMHHGSSRVTFVNADIAGGRGSLRLAGSRIASVSAAARPGDLVCAGDAVVDLHGDTRFEGGIVPPAKRVSPWRSTSAC